MLVLKDFVHFREQKCMKDIFQTFVLSMSVGNLISHGLVVNPIWGAGFLTCLFNLWKKSKQTLPCRDFDAKDIFQTFVLSMSVGNLISHGLVVNPMWGAGFLTCCSTYGKKKVNNPYLVETWMPKFLRLVPDPLSESWEVLKGKYNQY